MEAWEVGKVGKLADATWGQLLKWWGNPQKTNGGFSETKNDDFGVYKWGEAHHLRIHPYMDATKCQSSSVCVPFLRQIIFNQSAEPAQNSPRFFSIDVETLSNL